MIMNLTAGKSNFAEISVTYPAGAVCTCSNGAKTLTAKDTSGSWVFSVPKAGTWTVTATDGAKTKSAEVVITEKGQRESVALVFVLVLFGEGADTAITGGFSNVNENGYAGAFAGTNSAAGISQASHSRNKIDFSGYSTIHFNVVSSTQSHNGSRRVGLSSVADGNRNNYVAEAYANYTGEFTVDISAVTQECAVLIYAEAVPYQNGTYASTNVWCDRIWAD